MKRILFLWLSLSLLNTFSFDSAWSATADVEGPSVSRGGRLSRFGSWIKGGFRRTRTRDSSQRVMASPTDIKSIPTSSASPTAGRIVSTSLTAGSGMGPTSTDMRTTGANTLVAKAGQGVDPSALALQTKGPSATQESIAADLKQVTLTQGAQETQAAVHQKQAESDGSTGGTSFGRSTTAPNTSSDSTGQAPSAEPGDAVWFDEKEEEIDLEGVLTAAAKLMRLAHLGKDVIEGFEHVSGGVLKVLKNDKVRDLLGLDEPISLYKSFEDQMGEELIGRILGKDGPSKSLLRIIGPQGISEAIKFGFNKVPLPGMGKVGNFIGNFVETGMDYLTGIKLKYGTARSVVDAAYLSKTVATHFNRIYGPILETLNPQERADLITSAVTTAMFYIDRTVLEDPAAVITPQSVIRAIGTEFLDLDARMPRLGLLVRKMKGILFKKSGLDAYEMRALLTSTPVRIGDHSTLFSPLNDPKDPRRLIVKLMWRGVAHEDSPVTVPERFKDAHRVGTFSYGRSIGLDLSALPEIEVAAA